MKRVLHWLVRGFWRRVYAGVAMHAVLMCRREEEKHQWKGLGDIAIDVADDLLYAYENPCEEFDPIAIERVNAQIEELNSEIEARQMRGAS